MAMAGRWSKVPAYDPMAVPPSRPRIPPIWVVPKREAPRILRRGLEPWAPSIPARRVVDPQILKDRFRVPGFPGVGPLTRVLPWYPLVAPVVDPLWDKIYNQFLNAGYKPTAVYAPYAVLKCTAGLTPNYIYRYDGHVIDTLCGLGLQAEPFALHFDPVDYPSVGVGFPSGDHTVPTYVCTLNCADTDYPSYIKRFTIADVWWFNSPGGLPGPIFEENLLPVAYVAPGVGPQTDPNVVRRTRSELQPDTAPGVAPGITPDWLADLFETDAVLGPQIMPSVRVYGAPFQGLPPGIGERAPTKGRERKAKYSFKVLKFLDHISEAAEVVDSIYDALPKEIKKKWKCNRNTPFIDNAGQYGIDNADCKMKAIYHNLGSVDLRQAINNIIKNEITDRLYGLVYKNLPPQIGAALGNVDKRLDVGVQLNKKLQKALNDIFDYLGLQDPEARNR